MVGLLEELSVGTVLRRPLCGQTDYVNIAIHEMLHLAGRYSGYSDTQLATAASKLPGAAAGLPAPPKNDRDMDGIFRNSTYYDRELMKHCGPPR